MPLDVNRLVSLAEVIEFIQADKTLKPTQTRDWCSSIRSFVRCVDRDLSLEASPSQLRPALRMGPPPGTSRKTWSNIRSNLSAALKHCGCIGNSKISNDTKSVWLPLMEKLPNTRQRRGLSRFLNWCIKLGITPEAISQETFRDFHIYLTDQTIVVEPEVIYRDTTRLWNQASDNIGTWPQVRTSVPSRRRIISLGEPAFPDSFRADLDAWERRVSGKDLLNSDRVMKILRPATIRSNRATFVRCASILVHSGVSIGSIESLATLVQPDTYQTILQDYLDRHDQQTTSGIQNVAKMLAGMASHWARVSEDDQARLDELSSRLTIHTRGMSEKSKSRLRQFEDTDLLARLIDLPWVLRDEAARIANPKKAARRMRLAIIVGLCLSAPVRRRNIVELHLDRHLSIRRKGRQWDCHIHYSAGETKTKVDLDFSLNPKVTKLLIEYRDVYRPHLLVNEHDRWLFPGDRPGRHITPEALTDHLCKSLNKILGIQFNIHLFRHIAAKIYLERHPDDFVTVQQLLGHKQIQTTINFYCDFDRVKALSRYDAALFGGSA